MYLYPTETEYNSSYLRHISSMQPYWYNNTNFICPLYRRYFQRNDSITQGISKSELELSNKIRKLWEQHNVWTRMTIVSMVFDLPDVDLVTNRLLQNPVDFGNAFRVYYGDRIASRFRDLLREHLVLAAELVKAAKAGDNKTASAVEKRWYANADEIAAFLASINPYWSQEDLKRMLRKHLDLVKSEAVSMLTKNYPAEVAVYDELENQALEMADTMTQGIINQFPEKFK